MELSRLLYIKKYDSLDCWLRININNFNQILKKIKLEINRNI